MLRWGIISVGKMSIKPGLGFHFVGSMEIMLEWRIRLVADADED